jgi:hypothetical protein
MDVSLYRRARQDAFDLITVKDLTGAELSGYCKKWKSLKYSRFAPVQDFDNPVGHHETL